MPNITGIAHVELSVRDLDASTEWYAHAFGFEAVWSGTDAERELVSRAILHRPSGIVLGLMKHADSDGSIFSPNRTGLDHISFAVADRDEMGRWLAHFDRLGIAYSPITEVEWGAQFTVADPDGIAIELNLNERRARPAD